MSEVLVSALQARLDHVEQLALAAQGRQWDDDYDEQRPVESVWSVDQDGQVSEWATGDTIAACTRDDWEHTALREGVAPHIAANGPQAVLRLCRAHRDIIELYQGALHTRSCHPDHDGNNGYVWALEHTLTALARGFGVEETTGNDQVTGDDTTHEPTRHPTE